MRIRSFEVSNLFGRDNVIKMSFYEDLNILTGRNGAGKTSIMKLLWCIISGNILLGLKEVNFSKATVTTDAYSCTVHRLGSATCRVEFSDYDGSHLFEDSRDEDGEFFTNAEDQANPLLIERGSSVFFPTFRRIEGGFTLTSTLNRVRSPRSRTDIEEVLITLSRNLTNEPHVFVSSISTVDITGLLLRQYTDLSEKNNIHQQKISQEIIEQIKAFKSDPNDVRQIDTANDLLDSIRQKIEDMDLVRDDTMKPINAVKNLVERLFKHGGISFGRRLDFGDAASAINSDALSAGEKQMLSFICYNAFYKDSAIFIDEPELSLHVDWQRQLFPILQRQMTSNQFIIATHSPFIYSKYPDREIVIDQDRGDRESE